MKAAALGHGVDGQDRDVVRILTQIERESLIGPAHARVAVVNEPGELLVVQRRSHGLSHRRTRHASTISHRPDFSARAAASAATVARRPSVAEAPTGLPDAIESTHACI